MNAPVAIPCVIFAGGQSSRMGQNKALLPFENEPTLIQYQYHRLKKIFSEVYISTKCPHPFDFEADIICDPETDSVFAPTAGFVGSFEFLKKDSFFALSVDTPFITEQEISSLIEADQVESDATIAKTPQGDHPLCGIYHRSLEQEFQRMLQQNDHRLGKLLKKSKTTTVFFQDETPFLNLNHPHEYQNALQIIKNCH